MTELSSWRETLIDDRQRKEIAFSELYATEYNHGTTGHNQLLLIARLAELIDVAIGAKQLPPPPAPAKICLTFGKHSGRTLGELFSIDPGYLEWLAREARDGALQVAAQQVLAQPIVSDFGDDEDDDYLDALAEDAMGNTTAKPIK
jgi:hypothetical protein